MQSRPCIQKGRGKAIVCSSPRRWPAGSNIFVISPPDLKGRGHEHILCSIEWYPHHALKSPPKCAPPSVHTAAGFPLRNVQISRISTTDPLSRPSKGLSSDHTGFSPIRTRRVCPSRQQMSKPILSCRVANLSAGVDTSRSRNSPPPHGVRVWTQNFSLPHGVRACILDGSTSRSSSMLRRVEALTVLVEAESSVSTSSSTSCVPSLAKSRAASSPPCVVSISIHTFLITTAASPQAPRVFPTATPVSPLLAPDRAATATSTALAGNAVMSPAFCTTRSRGWSSTVSLGNGSVGSGHCAPCPASRIRPEARNTPSTATPVGSKNGCFCPRSGYKNCPRRGGGVKKWQNSVHVVVECPLTIISISILDFLSFSR
jgi:hypothetical protein